MVNQPFFIQENCHELRPPLISVTVILVKQRINPGHAVAQENAIVCVDFYEHGR